MCAPTWRITSDEAGEVPIHARKSTHGPAARRIRLLAPGRGLSRDRPRRDVRSRHGRWGSFPKPFRIGLRAIAWLQSDVDEWVAAPAARRLTFAAPPAKRVR